MAGWVLTTYPSSDPDTHPALRTRPAQTLYEEVNPESLEGRKVAVVADDGEHVEYARKLKERGEAAEVVIWSWRLPEPLAAAAEKQRIGVVYGWHDAAQLEEASRCSGLSETTRRLAALEEAAGITAMAPHGPVDG